MQNVGSCWILEDEDVQLLLAGIAEHVLRPDLADLQRDIVEARVWFCSAVCLDNNRLCLKSQQLKHEILWGDRPSPSLTLNV